MKLDPTTLAYIKNVVTTAQMVGIDNVVIEPGRVRAIDEDKKVVLFQETNVPDMPFGSVGLNRIGIFLSRLDIAASQDSFNVDVITSDEGTFARSFAMTAKGFKVEYRCANPATITAPKKVNDELLYGVELTPEAVYMLQKGQAAIGQGSEVVSVIYKDKGVTFEFADVNSDKFSHTFTQNITKGAGADDRFAHKYPTKILLSLFKSNPEGSFQIGKKGMLNFTVNSLQIFVLPQA